MAGYHLDTIPKGILGQSSKILEEVMELIDSEKQHCKIMALLELSDIIGAIRCYVKDNFSDVSIDDLIKMNDITARAFQTGERK